MDYRVRAKNERAGDWERGVKQFFLPLSLSPTLPL
jgi:hypothetical protein